MPASCPGGRKISDDSDAGDLGPVTSILSFVEAGAGDTRRQSLIHGLDNEDVAAERRGSGAGARKPVKRKEEVKVTAKEPVKVVAKEPAKEPIKQPVKQPIKPAAKVVSKDATKVAAKEPAKVAAKEPAKVAAKSPPNAAVQRVKKQPLRMSVTAPLSTSTSSSADKAKAKPGAGPGAGGRQLRATKSATAPVTPATSAASAASKPIRGGPKPASTSTNTNTLPKAAVANKNKKAPVKKVSSEYSSEIVFKNQEGLKFSSVTFFEPEEEGAQAR